MSENPIAERRVVLELPGMDAVSVQREMPYRDAGPHGFGTFDVYDPPAAAGSPRPAVVFVSGYPDAGARQMLGCRLKEMAAYVCWAQLVACSGIAAVTYDNEDPVGDVRRLLDHVTQHAGSLGVDASRLGIWSCSGNVPNALALLAERADLRCAAVCYGYMLDQEGGHEVADAAAQYGFVKPPSDLSVGRFYATPMLVARAGRDATPGLNASLDRFVTRALAENLPLSLVNHPEGPHAFDIVDPSARSRAVIRQILAFLKVTLSP